MRYHYILKTSDKIDLQSVIHMGNAILKIIKGFPDCILNVDITKYNTKDVIQAMIVKERGFSLELLQMEALDRRLDPSNGMTIRVQRDLRRIRSGIRGEKEVEYPLRFLEEPRYLILHDLRLSDKSGYFQIDTLILSESFILILEVKNWYGTITFGENGQVTRIGDDGIEEGFPNPIPQVKLQRHRLQNWLHSHGITNIPVVFFVVMGFPSTIIKSGSPRYPIPKQIIHNGQLLFEVQSLDQVYTTPKWGVNEMKKLSGQLIKSHTSPTINILDKYGIPKHELLKGVICPECSAVPMVRDKRKWLCRGCNYRSMDAHLSALNDYQLLIDDRISNQQVRRFLFIKSPEVAKKILQKEGFTAIGRTSARVYQLKWLDLVRKLD